MPRSKQLDTSAIALNVGAVESIHAPETSVLRRNPLEFDLPESETAPPSLIARGFGHNRGPPMLEAGDVLNGGREIHTYICELLGRRQTIAATYYQIAKGVIPARRYGERSLIASKRAIAMALAAGTGLVTDSPAASIQQS
jgi:hypothetical protein